MIASRELCQYPRSPLRRGPRTAHLLAAALLPSLLIGPGPSAHAVGPYGKLDTAGQRLPDSARNWACVEDSGTGLVWEHKTNDSSLRDVNNTYSWTALKSANRERYNEKDGGSCTGGIDCDTASYARRLNEDKLCGFDDWRVPTRVELKTLRTTSSESPKIDQTYFPYTWESVYWASSGEREKPLSIDFGDGFDYINRHSRAKYLRLVRGDSE